MRWRFLVVLTAFLFSPGPLLVSQQKPLPEFDALYKAVRENLARAQRSVHVSAFKERRTELHTNPFGKLGTGGTRLSDVYPSATPRLTYRRVIQRNGMPVSASDLMAQDNAYRERVAEMQRRPRTAVPTPQQRGERMINDVVDTLQFTLEGRAVRDGIQTVVIRFTPNADARPTTREGRMAQKFAGTVWIDEAQAEVMRVEAKTVDELSFGYGMVARLGEGTTALMIRRPIDTDIWMPTEIRLNGRGRAALGIRRLVIDFVVEWFDYRRLPVDLPAPFLDPRVHRQAGSGPQ